MRTIGPYQVKQMIPDDLKAYEAPTFWRLYRDKVWLGIAAALWLGSMFIPSDGAVSEPARAMPPGGRIFERPAELMRLTPPLLCRGKGGEQWIRSWGDGKLPPAIPTCVRARQT